MEGGRVFLQLLELGYEKFPYNTTVYCRAGNMKLESIVTVYIAAYNNYMYYLLLLNNQPTYR